MSANVRLGSRTFRVCAPARNGRTKREKSVRQASTSGDTGGRYTHRSLPSSLVFYSKIDELPFLVSFESIFVFPFSIRRGDDANMSTVE